MQGRIFSKAMECAREAYLPTAGKETVASHGLSATPSSSLFNSKLSKTDSLDSTIMKGSFSAEEQASGPTCNVNVVTRSGKCTDQPAIIAASDANPCKALPSNSHSLNSNAVHNARGGHARRKSNSIPEEGEETLDANGINLASPIMKSSRFSGTFEFPMTNINPALLFSNSIWPIKTKKYHF